MPTLSSFIKIVAFDDTNQTNQPKLQAINWNRDTLQGLPVEAPANNEYYLSSLSSKTIFDGTRTLSYDASTEFTVALSPLNNNRYRLTWKSGKDPVFRTDRSLSLTGGNIIISIQQNLTAIVTSSLSLPFSGVQVGDDVFIPGVTTGDTSTFNTLNEGHWVVLDASDTQLTLTRETGTVFSGISELVAITDNDQFMVYSSNGVQIDDVIQLISGFSPTLLHSYELVEVTYKFLEFTSTAPLPNQDVYSGIGSIVIYDEAKRFVYIETNQEVALTINGITLPSIIPFLAGDDGKIGPWMSSSIVYSMAITNNSTQQARVRVISAE
jgi:hypothetical protein